MRLKHHINVKGEIIDLSSPKVMGIINVTPDSFYTGSRKQSINEVMKTAEQMLLEGATFLDVGGYSSRPGADDILVYEEVKRVIPVIEALSKVFPEAILSIDTFRADVAKQAVEAGAQMVNDISAGHLDENMLNTVRELRVPFVAMHMRGTPQTMKTMTDYHDIVKEVMYYFSEVLEKCNRLGIKDVIIDPGFGFAKSADQSFELLKSLDHFRWLGCPLLVGLSRKSMIYRTLEISQDEALNGTSVLNSLALVKGASILRVHDVKEAMEAVKLINKLN